MSEFNNLRMKLEINHYELLGVELQKIIFYSVFFSFSLQGKEGKKIGKFPID